MGGAGGWAGRSENCGAEELRAGRIARAPLRQTHLRVGADLLVLGLDDLHPPLLHLLGRRDEVGDVGADLRLLRLARVLLGGVLGEDTLDHLVDHGLLLEELLVRELLPLLLLDHLHVELLPHQHAVLRAQVRAVRLRLQPPLAVLLHLLRHPRVVGALLLDELRRLEDLHVALLVHVRHLQLRLEVAELLALLDHPLHVLLVPHLLDVPPRELLRERLVLREHQRLALLRGGRLGHPPRRVRVGGDLLRLPPDPPLHHAVVRREVLAQHLVRLHRLGERRRLVVEDALRLQPLRVSLLAGHVHGAAGRAATCWRSGSKRNCRSSTRARTVQVCRAWCEARL